MLPLVGREREVGVLEDLVDRVGHAGGRWWCGARPGLGDHPLLVSGRHRRQRDPTRPTAAMAERAGCRTVEVKAGHLSMLSRPGPATDLVKKAARSVR